MASRSFPSQIVSYMKEALAMPGELSISAVESRAGAICGFLELYEEMPRELITVSGSEYAALVEAIGTVRLAMDRYRHVQSTDVLRSVGRAISTAFMLISNLPDQIPAQTSDLSFVQDPVLREMIGSDLAAINTDVSAGEWKSATILAGSCSEALLLYGLITRQQKSPALFVSVYSKVWPKSGPPVDDLTDRSEVPPLKWSILRYVFSKEDHDGQKEAYS